jgi:hypothetical protein
MCRSSCRKRRHGVRCYHHSEPAYQQTLTSGGKRVLLMDPCQKIAMLASNDAHASPHICSAQGAELWYSKYVLKGRLNITLRSKVYRSWAKCVMASETKQWRHFFHSTSTVEIHPPCNPVALPMDPNFLFEHLTDLHPHVDDLEMEYRKIVGELLYLAMYTHPDIAHTVMCLNAFNSWRLSVMKRTDRLFPELADSQLELSCVCQQLCFLFSALFILPSQSCN